MAKTVREDVVKKVQHQWVLLAILHGGQSTDGSITRKEIEDNLRGNGIRIAYSVFARIKNYLVDKNLVVSTSGKYNEFFFSPNYRQIVEEFFIPDKTLHRYLDREDYLLIEKLLSNGYVREVFFDPGLVGEQGAPLFSAIAWLMDACNKNAKLMNFKEFNQPGKLDNQELGKIYSPHVVKILQKRMKKLEDLRRKDPEGFYASFKLLSSVGKLNIRIMHERLKTSG